MNAICINFPQFYYEFYRINNEEEHKDSTYKRGVTLHCNPTLPDHVKVG